MKFNSFDLKKDLVEVLEELGYKEATKVQELVIPKMLKDNNLIVRSETGSGKTHSFLVPIINDLDFDKSIQALIVLPTKDLALQTYAFLKEFKEYYKDLHVKILLSGIDFEKNLNDIQTKSQIIIATPGRLASILDDSTCDLSNLKTIVLDEVDMLSGNEFIDDINKIINIKNDVQFAVFSATIPQYIYDFLKKSFPNRELKYIDCSSVNSRINYYFINTKHYSDEESLDLFLNKYNPYLGFIFANTREKAKKIYLYLKSLKQSCILLSGDLSLRERKSTLKRIQNNEFRYVVCTDIASRGIDIEDVSDVISLECPNNIEYFFHRAGRTARIGKEGNSYLFYNNESKAKVKQLINLGIKPTFLKISNGDIVIDEKPLDEEKKRKIRNDALSNEIKKIKSKSSKKIKPNYKKKVKIEVEKTKKKFNKKKRFYR